MLMSMWKYFKKSTELPFFDNMMENPDYFKRAKGMTFHIASMSPRDYLIECAKAGNTSLDRQIEITSIKLVKEYADRTLSGSKMPLPYIQYDSDGYVSQEGRHRALVAEQLGLKKMPVLIIKRKVN